MDKVWQEKWSKYGVKGFLILIADQQGGPAGPAACKKFRDDYEIEMTLLYDGSGLSAPYGGQETTYVLNADAELTYMQKGDWMAGIENELEKVLGFEME